MHAVLINNQDLVQAFLFLVYTPYKHRSFFGGLAWLIVCWGFTEDLILVFEGIEWPLLK